MNRKPLWIVLTFALAVAISGCSSSHKTPPAVITVAITTAPPASLEINASATIAATVTNDTAAAGVDWTCSPAATCGTFTPAHTASAGTTVYTAGTTAGAVTITAASTTTPTIDAMASVTVNPVASAASLSGTYTFFINGWDAADKTYSVAGSIVLDGAGNVTGGEQDYFDVDSGNIFTADTIAAGTGALVIGDDGRGTLTLTPTLAPPETLSLTVVNNNHVLIIEFDALATSSGSLDLQTVPASVPANGNAFTVHDPWDAFVFGGVFTSDGSSLITAGFADDDQTGSATFDNAITGSFTAPDASGRGTLTVFEPTFSENLEFAYYVVGPKVFRLVEIDGNFFAAGSVYGQGTTVFSSSSLGGNFAFGQSGDEGRSFAFWAAAGQFTGDGTSALSAGVADVNEGDGVPVLAGDLTGSTYFVNSDGYGGITLVGGTTGDLALFGVYMVDSTVNIADPNSSSGGGGALMLDLDGGNLGAGIAVPQTSGATFAGNYALNQDGAYATATTFSEFDLVGQVFSDGSSTLTGLADYNDLLETGLNPGITVAATFAADTTNPGRATAQVTLNGATTPLNVTFYQASSDLLLHVDVDSSATGIGTIGFGVLEQQQ